MTKRVVETEVRANVGAYEAGMDKAAKATEKLAATQEKASKSTDKLAEKASQSESWKTVSTGMLGAGAAAAAFGLALPTAKAASFEAAMAQVASTGPEARRSLSELAVAARESATDIDGAGYSAVQAAGGIEALLKAGVGVDDIMGGAMAGSLSLAAAGSMDVAAAAEAASSAMTQFKLSGRDVPRIADLLAAGAGKAQGDVSDLTQALSQSGLVASQFGLGLDETVGSLAAFASAGLLGSDAGTSFRSMLLRLANPAGEAADEMARLGIAAYDANGNFVGISSLADQLQDKLGKVDQATRDAALATIFGNDAIRAANVLYEQGAEGIDGWIDAVDEQGYAADMASTKLDSLNGDFQKLWGVIGEVGIAAGEANTGPLRALTQTITDLLRAASENPELIQVVAIGVGALGVAVAGLGLTMKVTTAVVEFQTALAALQKTAPRATSAIQGVGKAAGAAAILIGGLKVVQLIEDQFRDAMPAADDYTAAVKRAADATGNFDSLAGGIGGTLTGITRTISGAEEAMRIYDSAQADVIGRLTGLGYGGEAARIEEMFRGIDNALSSATPEDAAKAFGELQLAQEGAGWSTEKLMGMLPQYASQLDNVAAGAGMAEQSSEDLAKIASGDLPEGLQLAADGLSLVSTEAAALALNEQAAAEKAEALAEKLAGYADADSAFVDVVGAWDAVIAKNQEVAESAADASKDTGDSWEDFYDGHTVAIEDYLAELQTQVDAQSAWETNMTLLAGKASQGVLDHLAELGPKGAPLVQALVDATPAQMAEFETYFAEGAAGATGAFAGELEKAPRVWSALMGVAGQAAVDGAKAELAAGKTTLQGIINRYNLSFAVDADTSPADRAVNAFIARTRGRSASVDIYTRTMNRNGLDAELADGAVLEFYRSGGLRENHVAQIAPAGTWRVWAEDETGGEAYIPLAESKRPRSEAILSEVATRFGYALARRADGSVDVPRLHTTATPATAPAATSVTYVYNMEGREAMQTFLDQTRDATRRRYQTEGVHG